MDAALGQSLLELVEDASEKARGPDGKAALERIDSAYSDIEAALHWFVDQARADNALRLVNALYRFWLTKQRFDEGALWFDRALAAPGGHPQLRGQATIFAAFMSFWLGQDERGAEQFGRALEIGTRLDDAPLVSQALGGLARIALRTDVTEGRRLARQALEVSEGAADEDGRSNALHLLGVGAQIAGDLLEARDWMTRRLALLRSTGNEFLIASETGNLSMVERQLGNLDAAEALAREVLEIGRGISDEFMRPFAIAGLAAIAMDRRQFERAATLVGAAEAMMAAHNMAWPPDERVHYERMLAALPAAMGASEFDRARAAGLSMTPTEAVAFALDADSTE